MTLFLGTYGRKRPENLEFGPICNLENVKCINAKAKQYFQVVTCYVI